MASLRTASVLLLAAGAAAAAPELTLWFSPH
jgi:hypothetical protein